MTAEAAEIPYEVLNKVMSRIINEVRGVNRVMYDLTSKPPERLSSNKLEYQRNPVFMRVAALQEVFDNKLITVA